MVYTSGEVQYETAARPIIARNRVLQPPGFWLEPSVDVVSRLEDAVYISRDGKVDKHRPVFAVFNARPSSLNSRMFSTLVELRNSYWTLFAVLATFFVLIWIAAFTTGGGVDAADYQGSGGSLSPGAICAERGLVAPGAN